MKEATDLTKVSSLYYHSANDLLLSFRTEMKIWCILLYNGGMFQSVVIEYINFNIYSRNKSFFNPWIPESLGALENLRRIEKFPSFGSAAFATIYHSWHNVIHHIWQYMFLHCINGFRTCLGWVSMYYLTCHHSPFHGTKNIFFY